MSWLSEWWARRTVRRMAPEAIRGAYQRVFRSDDGQIVMKHLLDNIYGIVYEGTDPQEAVILNARRTVVQEILDNSTFDPDPTRDEMLNTLNEQERSWAMR